MTVRDMFISVVVGIIAGAYVLFNKPLPMTKDELDKPGCRAVLVQTFNMKFMGEPGYKANWPYLDFIGKDCKK